MLYHLYEFNRAAVAPWRTAAKYGRFFWRAPVNPLSATHIGRSFAASLELFERMARRYGRPEFGIFETSVQGRSVPIVMETVWQRPFCRLVHFRKLSVGNAPPAKQPKLLIVAPLSGHYATLLRGTVQALLPHADVYITDWEDARQVPLAAGRFDLDDYIDYVIAMLAAIGEPVHVMAVCQPSVPVLAAVSLLSQRKHPSTPLSMILMGGPIDTRRSPTVVSELALNRGIDWLRRNVIVTVPYPHPGFMREVYPGFIQLTGFATMNLDRHVDAHIELFWHLVQGDGDSAEKHREFYDEYLSVMDLAAEYYLQTVEEVFIKHALPRGTFAHRGAPVDLAAIETTALMTVEGERDDISGVGQTEAAHEICRNIPAARRLHHLQPGVGHFGVFNGTRFRREIVPLIVDFIGRAEKKTPSSWALRRMRAR